MPKVVRSIAAYHDVRQTLNLALDKGDIKLTFPTKKHSLIFVSRCNGFRKLLRNLEEEAGREPQSPYDHLVISRPRLPDGTYTEFVTIKVRTFDMIKIEDEFGNEYTLNKGIGSDKALTPFERTAREKEEAAFLAEMLSEKGTGALGLQQGHSEEDD